MPLEADDLDRLVTTLEAMLDRFKPTGSIFLLDCAVPTIESTKGKHPVKTVTYSLPKPEIAKEIRESWKTSRRSMPEAGIVFPDGSIMTVLFVCKSLPIPCLLQPIAKEIEIRGSDGAVGYIEKYSYCFYPNSKKADEIGYFRYDFHVESMGDGDLGEHTYFHFHRSIEDDFRHATGPMFEFDKLVSGIEKVLAPVERKRRLVKTFLAGDFGKLLLDLTIPGITKLGDALMVDKAKSSKFKYAQKYDQFKRDNAYSGQFSQW